MPRVYIAGPMRGIADHNFPAFDEARDRALTAGWTVVSPADMDREQGDQDTVPGTPASFRLYAHRDLSLLLSFRAEDGDAIALLPGWEYSTGAKSEAATAQWVGLRILDARTFEPFSSPLPTNEQRTVLKVFEELLRAATADGGKKRAAGVKPPWWRDPEHEPAMFSHINKWKHGELSDKDSGAHPLVHLAWRALAIAYQETFGKRDPAPSNPNIEGM